LVLVGDFNLADIKWAGGQGRVRKGISQKTIFLQGSPRSY